MRRLRLFTHARCKTVEDGHFHDWEYDFKEIDFNRKLLPFVRRELLGEVESPLASQVWGSRLRR